MTRTPFTRRAARLGLNKPRPHLSGPRVVYFVDVYANYYDQELAESVVGVLRHAEVNVFVPSRQRSSGMAALIVGDVDHAREAAHRQPAGARQRGARRLHGRSAPSPRPLSCCGKNTSS